MGDEPVGKPPPVDLAAHRGTVEFVGWRGLRIDVERLYDALTPLGWKVDTEESNLMTAMSRTWRKEGIKVWVHLAEFVCAPPVGEVEALDKVCFYRFDPAAMPTRTMEERMYKPGDEEQDWYLRHREEWQWLRENGDPQTSTYPLLTAIAFGEVPGAIVRAALAELHEALWLAE